MKSFFLILVLSVVGLSQAATVISEKANLRGTPSDKGKIVNKVQRDESVEVIKRSGAWFLVQTKEYVGWLHGDTIRVHPEMVTVPFGSPENETRPTPQSVVIPQARSSEPSRTYMRGPRGGCYYLNSKGNKTYVDRSLCS